MQKVQVCIELEEAKYQAYLSEAERRGIPVANLIEQTVRLALHDLEEREEDDVPVIIS